MCFFVVVKVGSGLIDRGWREGGLIEEQFPYNHFRGRRGGKMMQHFTQQLAIVTGNWGQSEI